MDEEEIGQLMKYLEASVNFSRHIGLKIEEVRPGRAVFSVEIEEMHLNGAGSVHGGVHASLMDSAMAVALIAMRAKVSTTQMNLHYLEPAATGRLVCTAEVMHRTKRNAITEAKIHDQSGRLLASATAAFRIFEIEPVPETGPVNQEEGARIE